MSDNQRIQAFAKCVAMDSIPFKEKFVVKAIYYPKILSISL